MFFDDIFPKPGRCGFQPHWVIPPVGAVSNRTASAQLETANTKWENGLFKVLRDTQNQSIHKGGTHDEADKLSHVSRADPMWTV